MFQDRGEDNAEDEGILKTGIDSKMAQLYFRREFVWSREGRIGTIPAAAKNLLFDPSDADASLPRFGQSNFLRSILLAEGAGGVAGLRETAAVSPICRRARESIFR